MKHEELKRYNRQIILSEIGLSGQEKLKSAQVLMIGAGGLGCPILQYLAAAGVGKIGIVDDDVIGLSNLHRQILYSTADIGKSKAIVAKEKLKLLNSHINITSYDERFTADNAKIICESYDLVIDGSDNFETRYLVNDTCVALKKVLVFGSIFKFEAHIAVFNDRDGPNYRDVFPSVPSSDEAPNCAEVGVLGVLPGIVGAYMANEAIKIICGIGASLSGKLMIIDTLHNTTHIFNVAKQKQNTFHNTGATTTESIKTIHDEITTDELNAWLSTYPDELHLIDVRENHEFEYYNVGGINIPLHELNKHIGSLPENKKLIFCCQTGQRSKMAIQVLKPTYKGEMYHLKNGIT